MIEQRQKIDNFCAHMVDFCMPGHIYCIVQNFGGWANLVKRMSFTNILPSQIPDSLR